MLLGGLLDRWGSGNNVLMVTSRNRTGGHAR
jgi:hypothetical protein